MRHLLLLIPALIVPGMMAFAQDMLHGKVLGEVPGSNPLPLPGAAVYWSGTASGTLTDSTGHFQLSHHPKSDSLVIAYPGYIRDTIHPDHGHAELTITLESEVSEDVVIEEKINATEYSYLDPMQRETLGEAELGKAACCNLSESFETNPTVDASFQDAVTGSKQIRMLGLDGKYGLISLENMPFAQGLMVRNGLNIIPGPWASSIAISKGSGSVVNGYESMTGQIDIALRNPSAKEKYFFNGYVNQAGRSELNGVINTGNGDKGNTLLFHGNVRPWFQDRNDDTFMDNPTGYGFAILDRFHYRPVPRWEGQVMVGAVVEDRQSGQRWPDNQIAVNQPEYQVNQKNQWLHLRTKNGILFPGKPWKSIGTQLSGTFTAQDDRFGLHNYEATSSEAYANFLYQTMIGNTNHSITSGLSFRLNDTREKMDSMNFNRTEVIPGVFSEYTWKPNEKFTFLSGLRLDYHNLAGLFVTPRMHLRYAPNEKTVIRASTGRGYRMPYIFAENKQILATSRELILAGNSNELPYGLAPEISWNTGISLQREFTLNYREGMIVVDFYRTWFEQQAIMDMEDPDEVKFYMSPKPGYANALQLTLNYEPVRRLNVRTAYRLYQVKAGFEEGFKSMPFVPDHRGFVNVEYATKSDWVFDATVTLTGSQRIPSTAENPVEHQRATTSPAFTQVNAQITKKWRNGLEVYVGGENLTDFRQSNPIIDPLNPSGGNFDSSMIWGPVFGRMIYAGFRWKFLKKVS